MCVCVCVCVCVITIMMHGLEYQMSFWNLYSGQDPFEMNVKKRAKGTVDEPTLIPSLYEKRLVGCICKYDKTVLSTCACYIWNIMLFDSHKKCESMNWSVLGWLTGQPVVRFGNNFNVAIFLDTVNVIVVKLCMMVLLCLGWPWVYF